MTTRKHTGAGAVTKPIRRSANRADRLTRKKKNRGILSRIKDAVKGKPFSKARDA